MVLSFWDGLGLAIKVQLSLAERRTYPLMQLQVAFEHSSLIPLQEQLVATVEAGVVIVVALMVLDDPVAVSAAEVELPVGILVVFNGLVVVVDGKGLVVVFNGLAEVVDGRGLLVVFNGLVVVVDGAGLLVELEGVMVVDGEVLLVANGVELVVLRLVDGG